MAVLPLHWPCRDEDVVFCSCGDPDCLKIGEHLNALLTPGGLKDATTDAASVERRWGGGPHNVGILTGTRSGLIVVDVDRQRGGAALAQLERRHGPLPPTARFIAGDSEQLVFAHPRRPIRTAAKRIAAGIKVLADGEFVVAPPSLSADGQRRYVYPAPLVPDGLLIAALPPWLAGRICDPQRFPIPPELPDALDQLCRVGAAGERRNRAVGLLAELLLGKGINPYLTLVLARDWNEMHGRPPLPDAEVVGLVEDAFDQFPVPHRRNFSSGPLQNSARLHSGRKRF